MDTPKKNKMISVRATEEEFQRVKQFAAEVISNHRYLKASDVVRELLGLENTGIITSEMRKRLLGPPGERRSKTLKSAPPRKRDKIDDWLDEARGVGGGPMSEADRKTIRAIMEKTQNGEQQASEEDTDE